MTTTPDTRRLVLLFGYWPPTDIGIPARRGMLWKWRELQSDYRGSGYDVIACSPTFPAPIGWQDPDRKTLHWGLGHGVLSVDYHRTSRTFWSLALAHAPIAIMSFSRGRPGRSWEIEQYARNLAQSEWATTLHYLDPSGVVRPESRDPPFAGGSPQDDSPLRGRGVRPGAPRCRGRSSPAAPPRRHRVVGGYLYYAAANGCPSALRVRSYDPARVLGRVRGRVLACAGGAST
ncbi:MAG: hypothetical protein IPO88_20555 [Nannocystis sp.]|uniref:hypothetical protein n=1 Tax=Nannocystis sp. TaxID=1962667 RepID=UPI0024224F97|nr:hypothetical protein [Nannocystis sp.]MBK9755850.1 hypothetical protein [Nannocystis sp.]